MKPSLTYFQPLLHLVEQFVEVDQLHDFDSDQVRFQGVGRRLLSSPMGQDDLALDGFWESIPVTMSLGGAFDAVQGLRDVLNAEVLTGASPWTLTRQALESASTALWIMAPDQSSKRMERTLQFWRDDIDQREKWRLAAGRPEPVPNMRGGEPVDMSTPARLARLRTVGSRLRLNANVVDSAFNFHDVVAAAAESAGLKRDLGTSTWRAASGFAHSKIWPHMALFNTYPGPEDPNGEPTMITTFSEQHHNPAVDVLFAIFERAISRYEQLALTTVAGISVPHVVPRPPAM